MFGEDVSYSCENCWIDLDGRIVYRRYDFSKEIIEDFCSIECLDKHAEKKVHSKSSFQRKLIPYLIEGIKIEK